MISPGRLGFVLVLVLSQSFPRNGICDEPKKLAPLGTPYDAGIDIFQAISCYGHTYVFIRDRYTRNGPCDVARLTPNGLFRATRREPCKNAAGVGRHETGDVLIASLACCSSETDTLEIVRLSRPGTVPTFRKVIQQVSLQAGEHFGYFLPSRPWMFLTTHRVGVVDSGEGGVSLEVDIFKELGGSLADISGNYILLAWTRFFALVGEGRRGGVALINVHTGTVRHILPPDEDDCANTSKSFFDPDLDRISGVCRDPAEEGSFYVSMGDTGGARGGRVLHVDSNGLLRIDFSKQIDLPGILRSIDPKPGLPLDKKTREDGVMAIAVGGSDEVFTLTHSGVYKRTADDDWVFVGVPRLEKWGDYFGASNIDGFDILLSACDIDTGAYPSPVLRSRAIMVPHHAP